MNELKVQGTNDKDLVYRELDGIVTSSEALPDWDIMYNAKGQQLFNGNPPSQTLVLGYREKWFDDSSIRVFVVTTPKGRKEQRYASILIKLLEHGYLVNEAFVATEDVIRVLLERWKAVNGRDEEDEEKSDAQARCEEVFLDAEKRDASDIHLDTWSGYCELSYRVNGLLQKIPVAWTQEEGMDMTRAMYNTMVDKGSTKRGFDEDSSNSASVTKNINGRQIRLRYEAAPIEPDGTSVSLRLNRLGASIEHVTLKSLGYAPDQEEQIDRIFNRSSGLILFVGTTGSGKTTSLACCLSSLVRNHPGKLLRTIEEPVEILIPGARQRSVARKSISDEEDPFAEAMASMVRQDPDYMMVGEIRDVKTAKLALHGVRSGHLCSSTLHANGAPAAYDRLYGMGVPLADLATVDMFAGIIYQRLVPRLCDHCKIPAKELLGQERYIQVIARLKDYVNRTSPGVDPLHGYYFQNHAGCPHCKHVGLTGRTVCAEILVPTKEMLPSIRAGESVALWEAWRKEIDTSNRAAMRGRTAFEHAQWKMDQGWVSPEDVEREFRYLDEEVWA